MSSVNKVILIGRVGSNPDVRHFGEDKKSANFSLATSDRYKDKSSGEYKETTEWHRITVFNKLAEIVEEYVSKGSLLYIEGRIKTDKWQDKEGKDQYSTGIIADSIKMLSKREKDAEKLPMQNTKTKFVDEDIPF